MKFKFKIFFLILLSINLFAWDKEVEEVFKKYKVEGTIVIESLNKKKINIYNDKRASELFAPASTFKIPHSLIALNEGIVKKDSKIIWNKKVTKYKSCNKNQTIKSAFRNSCLWVYEKFASNIDTKRYKEYLKKMDYGDKNIKNNSIFWLDGTLKITTFGQIKFLKKLHLNELSFNQNDIDFIKNIMIEDKNESYILRAKTGWQGEYGWYIGYVQTKDDVWFFAMNIDTKSKSDLPKRKAMTLEILKLKGII